jgi:hypothetical protein
LLVAGFWIWGYMSASKIKSEEEAVVLIEQIRSVTKMIAVEATLSEIYEYSDFWGYDVAPLRKKALIKVKAVVSIGYDLENLKLEAIPDQKKIVIGSFGQPTILSLDQELNYYDLSSGWLNTFNEKALSDLQVKSRKFIEQKVQESNLYAQAEAQRDKWIEGLREIIEFADWTLVYEDSPIAPRPFLE